MALGIVYAFIKPLRFRLTRVGFRDVVSAGAVRAPLRLRPKSAVVLADKETATAGGGRRDNNSISAACVLFLLAARSNVLR